MNREHERLERPRHSYIRNKRRMNFEIGAQVLSLVHLVVATPPDLFQARGLRSKSPKNDPSAYVKSWRMAGLFAQSVPRLETTPDTPKAGQLLCM